MPGYSRMRTKWIALIAVLTMWSEMDAQNFCKRTSVFFEHDASEITGPTQRRLDSLARVMKDPEYIIELYGHTDSTGSYNYNTQLAHDRMRAIEAYLRPKTNSKLVFTENNLSETNYKVSGDIEKNLAFNRRVDIFLVPVSNGNVQMTGKNHGAAELPPALFGPCGICNSQPAVKTFLTHQETDAAGILLETSGGDSLITAGMIMLDYNPCTGVSTVPSVTFRMCPGKPDPGMKLWEADTTNGKIRWVPSKDTLRFDYTTGCYVFTGRPGMAYNVDKRFMKDTIFRIVPSKSFAYEQFVTTDERNTVKYKAEQQDSVELGRDSTKLLAHAVGKKGDDYYLLTWPVDSMPYTYYPNDRLTNAKSYELPAEKYTKLLYSDTLLKVRCGRKAKPGQMGVYLTDYHQYIPFDSTDGKYYYGKKPTVAYQYAYKKGKRLRALKTAPEHSKYTEENQTERIKFKRKERNKFRSVKVFFEAQV